MKHGLPPFPRRQNPLYSKKTIHHQNIESNMETAVLTSQQNQRTHLSSFQRRDIKSSSSSLQSSKETLRQHHSKKEQQKKETTSLHFQGNDSLTSNSHVPNNLFLSSEVSTPASTDGRRKSLHKKQRSYHAYKSNHVQKDWKTLRSKAKQNCAHFVLNEGKKTLGLQKAQSVQKKFEQLMKLLK